MTDASIQHICSTIVLLSILWYIFVYNPKE